MQNPSIEALIPVLRTAVGPVILISGVGLLLLSMTNRLGRALDRARRLADDLATAGEPRRAQIEAQLRILWRRAHSIRVAIALASVSALAAALLIITLFFTALWKLEIGWLIVALFVASMVGLVGSLVAFLHDVNQCLSALRLELGVKRRNDFPRISPGHALGPHAAATPAEQPEPVFDDR